MMTDHLDNKNLVPFFKRRGSFRMMGGKKSHDEEMLEQVDPNLRPEDEGVILRYLNYADTLLGSPDEHGLTLIPGGGPAKTLAGNPETAEDPAPEQTEHEPETDAKDKDDEAA
jgi:hypothetical protein